MKFMDNFENYEIKNRVFEFFVICKKGGSATLVHHNSTGDLKSPVEYASFLLYGKR
jgi:hypothetical protein